jgi:hypothetical protein
LPFDQFTIEQLAGDLLPAATFDQKVATGFHRCTTINLEAGTDQEENRTNQVIDRVNVTGTVWLGTTLECCQCHNHKYDPFTQRDYYRTFACFNSTAAEADPIPVCPFDPLSGAYLTVPAPKSKPARGCGPDRELDQRLEAGQRRRPNRRSWKNADRRDPCAQCIRWMVG